MTDAEAFLEQLRRDPFVRDAAARLTPLSGGVSSDIYLVDDGGKRFVVKRALARLKVMENWTANVSRNAAERDYIECVGEFLPQAVPRVLFENPQAGYFGMEYLDEGFVNWKTILLQGECKPAHAQMAGNILGEIHRQTARREDLRKRFDTTANFRELRTSPYLLTTARKNPEFLHLFTAEIERLEGTRECLVHGDFSPKNVLIRGDRMVLLDCEVAWYGDPAFDIAFLLNHFFLKGLYHAPRRLALFKMVDVFWRSYESAGQSGDCQLELRVTRLLPMLLLSRVDGKSPVEYLDSARKEFVRGFVREQMRSDSGRLDFLAGRWFSQIEQLQPVLANS
jgi:aminoglycoside phosphotransferase (APT) family kinase protein